MKLMTSPITSAYEIETVAKFVSDCETLEDTSVASKMVDLLQRSQPEEREIIKSLRNEICDMSFDFFFKKYPNLVK